MARTLGDRGGPLDYRPEDSSGVDVWVCRIPRVSLHALAANAELRYRERVLIAVIAELYSHREGGCGKAGVPRLERITGLDRRSVRRAMAQLEQEGVLVVVEAKPGQMKVYRLTGGATVAPGPESAPPEDRTRATHRAQTLRHPPGANAAPALNEEGKERSSSRTPVSRTNHYDGMDKVADLLPSLRRSQSLTLTDELRRLDLATRYRRRKGEPRGKGEPPDEAL